MSEYGLRVLLPDEARGGHKSRCVPFVPLSPKHLDPEVVPGRVNELHANRDSTTVSINIAGKGQGVVVPSATSNSFASYGPYKWGPWTADSPGIQRVDGSLTTQFRFSLGVSDAQGHLKSEVHFKGLKLNAVSS